MRKILFLSAFLMLSVLVSAQVNTKNRLSFQVVPELSLPLGDFSKIAKTTVGFSAKALYRMKGKDDQVTLAIGYVNYNLKGIALPPGIKANYSIVPIMLGYRTYIKKLFLESQVGAGFYTVKVSNASQSASQGETNFTWAQSIGYSFGDLELNTRYQQGNLKGTADKLTVLNIGLNYTLFR